jgi:hypothetical protein
VVVAVVVVDVGGRMVTGSKVVVVVVAVVVDVIVVVVVVVVPVAVEVTAAVHEAIIIDRTTNIEQSPASHLILLGRRFFIYSPSCFLVLAIKKAPGGAQKLSLLSHLSFPNTGGITISGNTLRTSDEIRRLRYHALRFQVH